MIQQLDVTIIQPAMKKACHVVDVLLRAGYSAYFVGGAVRDTLLHKQIHDIDIATSAKPEEVVELFPHVIPTGLQHGTVTVVLNDEMYEVTTFRKEAQYEDFRRPAEVLFVTDLIEDLQRRDFTMNAMAIDSAWRLYDPFGGQADMRIGLLATVGDSQERFQEDALRMLRALRFALTYELRISDSCYAALLQCGHLLKFIAMERVCYELMRMMNGVPTDKVAELLLSSQLLTHTREKLHLADGKLPIHKRNRSRNLSKSTVSGNWSSLFTLLDIKSEQALQDLLALRVSKKLQQEIITMLQLNEWVSSLGEYELLKGSDLSLELKRLWYEKLLVYPASFIELWLTQFAAFSPIIAALAAEYERIPIKRQKDLAIGGKQLLRWGDGQAAGPWVKQLLDQIFLKVVAGELKNNAAAIERYVKSLY